MGADESTLSAIERLAALRASGVLTEQEFATAKAQTLLNSGPHSEEQYSSVLSADEVPFEEGESWEYEGAEDRGILPKGLMLTFALIFLVGIGGTGYLTFAKLPHAQSDLELGYAAMEPNIIDEPPADAAYMEDAAAVEPDVESMDDILMEDAGASDSEALYKAQLSCRYAGQPVPLSMCLYGSGRGSVHGELKIQSDGSVTQFGEAELATMTEYRKEVYLQGDFHLQAQAGDDGNAILRVEVFDLAGDMVYQDEASTFGLIDLRAWELR